MFKRSISKASRQLFTCPVKSTRWVSTVSFDWRDPLNLASQLTEEEQAIQETAHSYCQERMLPRVLGMFPALKIGHLDS